MSEMIPVEVSILHTPDPRFSSPFYTALTPANLENREIPLADPLPLNTTLHTVKTILKESYGIPLEIQWGFQRDIYDTEELPDETTLAELRSERMEAECQQLVLLTTAWRVKTIPETVYSVVRRYRHYKAAVAYLRGRFKGVEQIETEKELKVYERREVAELERFKKMVSDLGKYTGDGAGKDPELSELDMFGWLESFERKKYEKLHQITGERYAAFKASSWADTLLGDISDDERKATEPFWYNYFTVEQKPALLPLGLSQSECAAVLGELWARLDDTDRECYVSEAVQKRRAEIRYDDSEYAELRCQQEQEEEDKRRPDRLTFDHSPISPRENVIVHPLRDDDGTLPETAFTVSSGKLIWGQMQTVIAGSRADGFDGNAEGIQPMPPGGTIKQYVYKYRCAARNGGWRVKKAYSNYNGYAEGCEKPDRQLGWVVYHADIDPLGVIERCSKITPSGGISNGNKHVDKDVLYIGRYDWAWHSGDKQLVCDALKEEIGLRIVDTEGLQEWDAEVLELQSERWGGYMMVLDAEGYSPDFLATFLRDCPAGGIMAGNQTVAELGFSTSRGTVGKFGAFLSMPATEYEFAWLVFSGKKHDTFKEIDELIAIVYDGAYHALDANKFAIET